MECISDGLINLIPMESEYLNALGAITSKMLMIVTVFILSVFWEKRNYRYLPGKFYLYLLLVPTGSIWIIVIQFVITGELVDVTLVLLLFNLVVFEIFLKLQEIYGEKMEQEVMQRQVAMYQNEFEIIKESDKNVHLLRHDLKNHMLLLAKYLEKGEYEAAKNYANEIAQVTGTAGEYVRTGNSGVDSIVNYMHSKAEKLGVKFQVTIQVPETPFMPDFNLTMLLSNLLENALDALEKVELKTLVLFMNYNKQVLYISVCNTFDGNVRKRGEIYLTTKEEKGEHGLGIAAIQRIVEKYHGEISMEHTEKMFGTDITLYVSENRGEP
ncbi:MAG: GHKL domain-containing protein [Roseburia sp.]|nr:GHKL domain-containing protein [Roseburia sp.]